jgi:hypothetical protein
MKVDMSSEAVTQRLRIMDELWLLSTKLMNSKRVARNSPVSKKDRALRIQDSIRRILFYDWDPIGISKDADIPDEYDSYVGPVYRRLVDNCSEEELIKFLFHLERTSMGLSSKSPELLRPVAQKLIGLNIHL